MTANAQATPGSERGWLICKYGLYYAPNSQGYTGIRDKAGRYTEAEAIAAACPNGPNGPREGMDYIHESNAPEFSPKCFDDLKAKHLAELRDAATARAEAAEARVAELTEDRLFVVGANHGYETAMEQAAAEARRYADLYPQGSDGRNTFTLLAEWADSAALKGATP